MEMNFYLYTATHSYVSRENGGGYDGIVKGKKKSPLFHLETCADSNERGENSGRLAGKHLMKKIQTISQYHSS